MNEESNPNKQVSSKQFLSILRSNPYYEKIIQQVDIFHIYEPLLVFTILLIINY